MPENSRPNAIKIHYIKGNYFRVSHADGAIGNITPGGLIFIGFYSERAAIPQIMVHEITEEGQLGPEHSDERVAKEGIVRELDTGAIMSVATAKHFVKWLQEQINVAEQLGQRSKQESSSPVN